MGAADGNGVPGFAENPGGGRIDRIAALLVRNPATGDAVGQPRSLDPVAQHDFADRRAADVSRAHDENLRVGGKLALNLRRHGPMISAAPRASRTLGPPVGRFPPLPRELRRRGRAHRRLLPLSPLPREFRLRRPAARTPNRKTASVLDSMSSATARLSAPKSCEMSLCFREHAIRRAFRERMVRSRKARRSARIASAYRRLAGSASAPPIHSGSEMGPMPARAFAVSASAPSSASALVFSPCSSCGGRRGLRPQPRRPSR